MDRARNDGQIIFVPVPMMEGLSIALKYFDDDRYLYVSPTIAEKLKNNELDRLDFFTLVYPKGTKPIKEIVLEIIDKIQKNS